MALAGRAFVDVLTHEHIPADAIITGARVDQHWTTLTLDMPTELLRKG